MENQPNWYWIILKKEMEEDSTDGGIENNYKGGRLEIYFE